MELNRAYNYPARLLGTTLFVAAVTGIAYSLATILTYRYGTLPATTLFAIFGLGVGGLTIRIYQQYSPEKFTGAAVSHLSVMAVYLAMMVVSRAIVGPYTARLAGTFTPLDPLGMFTAAFLACTLLCIYYLNTYDEAPNRVLAAYLLPIVIFHGLPYIIFRVLN